MSKMARKSQSRTFKLIYINNKDKLKQTTIKSTSLTSAQKLAEKRTHIKSVVYILDLENS